MSNAQMENRVIPIDQEFFNDGHYVVLLSQSLGGSGLDPHQIADTLGNGDARGITECLTRGVCLPICFGTDCALDGATQFVIGDLGASHEKAWIARLTGKLSIPCGKLVLLSGGGDGEELARAVSGKPADRNYVIYQHIDVPPGNYRVDVLAYASSVTVGLLHEDLDDDELNDKYAHLPRVEEAYVVHLTPLDGDVATPGLVDEIGWPGIFELREPA